MPYHNALPIRCPHRVLSLGRKKRKALIGQFHVRVARLFLLLLLPTTLFEARRLREFLDTALGWRPSEKTWKSERNEMLFHATSLSP